MCDHGIREVEKHDFDAALIGNIGNFISSAMLVDLTGLGEPFLSKFFWKILENYPVSKKTTGRDFVINFNTNGTLLTKENVQKVLNARVRRIRISIDTADEDLYNKIRGGNLSHVATGVRNLISMRNSLDRLYPQIGIQMTLMKENLNSVQPMIDFCKEVGADFLDVWSLNNMLESSMEAWVINKNGWVFNYKEQLLSGIPPDKLNRVIADFHEYARHRGLPIWSMILGNIICSENFPSENYWENPGIKWREESIRCILPWKEQRIHCDGNVFCCCWGPSPIGNIRNSTLKSIWNGQAIKEMRSDLLSGKVPRFCVGAACPYLIGKDLR
jgi:MoaA/NifB/PqqE/SkfB family radical SAM enzyme